MQTRPSRRLPRSTIIMNRVKAGLALVGVSTVGGLAVTGNLPIQRENDTQVLAGDAEGISSEATTLQEAISGMTTVAIGTFDHFETRKDGIEYAVFTVNQENRIVGNATRLAVAATELIENGSYERPAPGVDDFVITGNSEGVVSVDRLARPDPYHNDFGTGAIYELIQNVGPMTKEVRDALKGAHQANVAQGLSAGPNGLTVIGPDGASFGI